MALASILAAIKTTLEGVSGIGIVHDRLRYAKHWKDFLSFFLDSNDKINGWMITRTKTPAEAIPARSVRRAHTFRIVGIYGVRDADATETTFQNLVEAIQNAFDTAMFAGGVLASMDGTLQVDEVTYEVFGDVLCHYTEMTIEVLEDKAY